MERPAVKVAMLSKTFYNWSRYFGLRVKLSYLTLSLVTDTAGPPQLSVCLPFFVQNIDFSHSSESGNASTSSLPGSFPAPTIRGDASKSEKSLLTDDRSNSSTTHQDLADGALRRVGHAAEYFVYSHYPRIAKLIPDRKSVV